VREGLNLQLVPASRRVNLAERREIVPREAVSESHQRRPEAAVNIGDLVVDEPTDQHITGIPNRPRQPEDILPFRMAPPASLYSLANYGLGQVWNGPLRTLKDNTMTAYKGEGSSRSHFGMGTWRLRRRRTTVSRKEEHDGHHNSDEAQNHEGVPQESGHTVFEWVRPSDSRVLDRAPVAATEAPPNEGHGNGQRYSAGTD
jgi:hypothetical protein